MRLAGEQRAEWSWRDRGDNWIKGKGGADSESSARVQVAARTSRERPVCSGHTA